MRAAVVARKDFEDVIRSYTIWAVLALFVALMVVVTVAGVSATEETVGSEAIVDLFVNIGAQLLLPIIAIMLGYKAIVGERQSGSLRVLFGLNLGRDDVFFGKVASRLGAIGIVTAISLAVGVALAIALADSFDAWLYVRFAGLTILLGLAFTAVAVAFSAATASRYRAMGGAIGAYAFFAMFWHPIAAGIHYLVMGERPGYHAPEWYFLLTRLNPLEAYTQVVSVWIDQYLFGLIGWVSMVEDVEVDMSDPTALLVTSRVEGDLPFYLGDGFAVVTLLAWIVVPLLVARWRFNRVDLN